ncbi:RNA polymerase sigma factor [uncultured Microbacterium sp.]|uniref:RNA polymerase sigma factor n=1 Tax=uncultured Microbacterium sp. TaxID=191216 RepID=UPI0025EAA82F|nr:RNA polymerase sigma factor [uncultured Microbacterium sp.]
MTDDLSRRVAAIWRIEGARIVATLARVVGDLSTAEDLAQDAVAEALAQWPREGVPRSPGAWLTAVAKRRAIDGWRRAQNLSEKYGLIGADMSEIADADWQPIDDDVLRLVFTACHPVLPRQAQVALTLKVVGGLDTEAIARLFLVSVPTMQQRIVRAKKALTAARVPFEVPEPTEWAARRDAVLSVIYLIFTEGYSASGGDAVLRTELAHEALRLGRLVNGLLPREPEALGLSALMELQASRFAARVDVHGDAVLLADQDRRRWDRSAITRGATLLDRADALARRRGPYQLQAAIALCHTEATSVETTDWARIVSLYEALGRVAPSPVVELNRAVAVSMASGPLEALAMVDRLRDAGALTGSHLIPSVRGELLSRLGRTVEAREALLAAAERTRNGREAALLRRKAAALG